MNTPTQNNPFGANGFKFDVGFNNQDLLLIGLVIFGSITLALITANLVTRNIK